MGESHQDMEWVVNGPHASMVIKRPIDVLEREILSLLRVHGAMRLAPRFGSCAATTSGKSAWYWKG